MVVLKVVVVVVVLCLAGGGGGVDGGDVGSVLRISCGSVYPMTLLIQAVLVQLRHSTQPKSANSTSLWHN